MRMSLGALPTSGKALVMAIYGWAIHGKYCGRELA